MKHARLVLLALLLIPGSIIAQTTQTAGGITPRATSGDFALLFDLGGLANLALNGFSPSGGDTTTVGAGFGAKYFIANNVALRLALTLESNNATRPIDSIYNDEFSAFRLGVAPSVTVNVVTSGPVAGYVGGGISFATTSSTSDPADSTQPNVDASGTSFGVAAIIGAEWFPWTNVSLAAEYNLGYARSTSDEERTIGGTTQRFERPTESSIGLRSRGVLTAAIYW
jgi:opacity protein-like surface antigen